MSNVLISIYGPVKIHSCNSHMIPHLRKNSFKLLETGLSTLHPWLCTLSLGPLTHEPESPWPLHFASSHYAWGTNGVCECKMDVKSTWNSYMTSNGSCCMVTWTIFKNRMLERGLTQNRETMTLQTLTTNGLFYFITCEDPHEMNFIEIAFGWGLGHFWLHTTLEGPWPHDMMLEVC